ncbi:MAG TPA: hypothetical protein VGQ20_00470 [Acidimicrobiales bacterium]|nr:hypothetical protein [Acidimicrobiales bacterium]
MSAPPRGRKALFTEPAAAPSADADTADERAPADPRHAHFSAAPRRKGTVIVECSTCDARTPLNGPELFVQLVPSVWWPFHAYSRWMRCPSCRAFTWCRVDWRSLRI